MASDLQTVAQLLNATLDHRQHKQGESCVIEVLVELLLTRTAEIALKAEEKKPGFSLLLLNIVALESLPLNTRLSGALCFKNFIKFNWVVSN
jgi:exportin-2 (importin alpha re-exporter)